jgi:hypothetical protein
LLWKRTWEKLIFESHAWDHLEYHEVRWPHRASPCSVCKSQSHDRRVRSFSKICFVEERNTFLVPLDVEERVQWLKVVEERRWTWKKCQFVDEFGPETLEREETSYFWTLCLTHILPFMLKFGCGVSDLSLVWQFVTSEPFIRTFRHNHR